MSDDSVAAIKQRGITAYKEARFSDALQEFKLAIAGVTTEEDVGNLHLLYSNLSATYQQLKDFQKGAESAESCVQAKPTWAKGYSHLGVCKFKVGLYDDSISAYKKALELEPNNSQYQDGIKLSEKHKTASRNQSKSDNFDVMLQAVLICVWLAMFAFGGRYLASFSVDQGWLQQQNTTFVKFYLMASCLSFYRNHGVPKLSKEFGMRVVMDNSVQRVMGAMTLLVGANFLIMTSLMLPQLANFMSTLIRLVRKLKLHSVADKIAAPCIDLLLDRTGSPYYKVEQVAAHMEVAAVGVILLNLLTPRRSFLLLLLYCQYLQLRYVIESTRGQNSGPLHIAFSLLDQRASYFVGKCPSFVGASYSLLKNMIQRQVKLPDANEPSSSRCTVM